MVFINRLSDRLSIESRFPVLKKYDALEDDFEDLVVFRSCFCKNEVFIDLDFVFLS